MKTNKPKSDSYPNILTTYGDHIRAKRLEIGLFQKQVAEQIGVDEASIYNWENNRVHPEIRFIPRIIEFLGYALYEPSQSLVARLKQCRQALGFSHEKMAKILEVDESTLAGWEFERNPLSVRYERLIQTFLISPVGIEFCF